MALIAKPVRPRSEAHLRWLRTLPCIISGSPDGVIVHHLMHGEPSAAGARSGDCWAVPLLHSLHDAQYPGALHRLAREPDWWAARGINPVRIATRLWCISLVEGRVKATKREREAAHVTAGDWATWLCRGYRFNGWWIKTEIGGSP